MDETINQSSGFLADEGTTGFESGSAEAAGSANNSQVAADTGTANGSEVDAKATEFQNLISGEYKAEYQATLEAALNKRLKTSKQKLKKSEAFREQVAPLLERCATKYALSPDDIAGIIAAAEEDDSYFEEYAVAHNVPLSEAKILAKAERITAAEEQRKRDAQLNEEFNKKYSGWLRQADELKQFYPSFDFEYESTNEETGSTFRTMLNSGISVRNAYEVLHKDELMGGAMQYAYQTAKQEAADARTARLNRPIENGTSQQQASTINDDMTHLTKEQRQRIKAAVDRGEKVSESNFRRYL